MEEEAGKRKGCVEPAAAQGDWKRLKVDENGEEEEEEDCMMEWLMMDEETAAELSKLLDEETSSPPAVKVKFIDDPYTTPVVFQSSTAYVTINGNEESCGSSYSESESSVMASVDMSDMKRSSGGGGEWGAVDEEARGDVEGFLVKDWLGCYDLQQQKKHDDEDAMWVQFLGDDLFGSSL